MEEEKRLWSLSRRFQKEETENLKEEAMLVAKEEEEKSLVVVKMMHHQMVQGVSLTVVLLLVAE